MRYQVTFQSPEEKPTFGDYTEYRFPYDIVDERYIDTSEQTYQTLHCSFSVQASRTLIACWNVDDSNLVKRLFEHGRRGLFEVIKGGGEYDSWSLKLGSHSEGVEPNRFDLDRVLPVDGSTYFVELDEIGNQDISQTQVVSDGIDNSSKGLNEALLSSFRTRAELKRMLRLELGENLDSVTGNANLEITVFELTEWAKSRGRLEDLIRGAYRDNPDNPELKAFVESHNSSEPDTADRL